MERGPPSKIRCHHGDVSGPEGYVLELSNLKTSAAYRILHDTGRESDFGEDLWDEQSGKICEEFATCQLKLKPEEAHILSRSIAEKDKDPLISLEQKIIHDADCAEIFRCFLSNPGEFRTGKIVDV